MSEQLFQSFDEMARVLVQHMRRTGQRLTWRPDYYRLVWYCEDPGAQDTYVIRHATLKADTTFRSYYARCPKGPGRVTDKVLDHLYQEAQILGAVTEDPLEAEQAPQPTPAPQAPQPAPVRDDRYEAVEEDWL